jgi:hypothetical protein
MLPGIAGIAGVGGRKVTSFSYQTEDSFVGNLSTFTFNSQAFGSAATDRIVIVSVMGGNGSAGTISSVTIGGVSASILVQVSDANLTGGIAVAAVPTGTTGSVVVNMSTTRGGCAIGIWSATGQVAASGVAVGSNTDLAELTLAAEIGGFVIAMCGNLNSSSRTATWAGVTENFDNDAVIDGRHSGASDTLSLASVSLQPTLSGAATSKVFVAATF